MNCMVYSGEDNIAPVIFMKKIGIKIIYLYVKS